MYLEPSRYHECSDYELARITGDAQSLTVTRGTSPDIYSRMLICMVSNRKFIDVVALTLDIVLLFPRLPTARSWLWAHGWS